jgi:hypothetical protein
MRRPGLGAFLGVEMSRVSVWLALFGAAAAPCAAMAQGAQVTPNLGAVQGEGTLQDNDGNSGTWSIDAVLSGGDFTGTGAATIRGVTVRGPLANGGSFYENGRCHFRIEEGRYRVEIGGPCTTTSIDGHASGFVAGNTIVGSAKGVLKFGKAGAGSAAPKAVALPTAKLTCAWMERVGGVVAGDLPNYQLRMSNMVTLTLSPNGTYRTNSASGSFVREGDRLRLTSGAFAGAGGRLQPDRSGQPAVYFEREENRRANGVHIVDPGRTACTVAR